MSWTYDDYITLSGSAQVTRLQLHIQEVSAKIGPSVGADGKNIQREGMIQYRKDLLGELKELLASGAVSGGNTSFARRGE